MKSGLFRGIAILFVCIVGIFLTVVNFIPGSSVFSGLRFNLGLDLRGGSDLLLEVNFEEYLREKIVYTKDVVARDLKNNKIGYTGLRSDNSAVYFTLRNGSDASKVASAIKKIEGNFEVEDLGSSNFKVHLSAKVLEEMRSSVKMQSIEIIRRRIDERGNKEILLQAGSGNRIILQVPGNNNPEEIKKLLNVTAKMSFHLMDDTAPFLSSPSSAYFAESRILEGYDGQSDRYYVVKNRTEIDGSSLVSANAVINNGDPAVNFELDSVGARIFAEITRNNIGKPFAIVLDNKVLSAPVIREPIVGGAGSISGGFTLEEAKNLALLLRSGALPASIKVLEERIVSPSLGEDSIAAGKWACLLALVLVVGFMLLKYRLLGIFASISLLINISLIIAGLGVLGSTLTLPGIAGIVLTMGMAVDANVLIFERIKEISKKLSGEKRKVQFLKSIEDGFRTSKSTILDSNITTIATASMLYFIGFGPIRGFAVTLILGILTSMFSAIILTGEMLKIWARAGKKSL